MTAPPIPIIDGHNDLPWKCRAARGGSVAGLDTHQDEMQTDLPRLHRGAVAGQFWSAWLPPEFSGAAAVQATLEQIDLIHRMVAAYPQDLHLARTAADVQALLHTDRIASLIGIEGGHQIADSLPALRQYARLGVRYMTLTWNHNTTWADSATDTPEHGGLAARGHEVVAEMNRIGMVVDLSHVAPSTMRQALERTAAPVLFTHSSCAALNPHPRNVPDEVIAALPGNGGVQMVTFVPSFLSAAYWDWRRSEQGGPAPQVGVATVADHIEHVREVAGIDHVGLGGDYDGAGTMPAGLQDVAGYPNLMDELRSRGWSEEELGKLGHQNVLRVLADNDGAYRAFCGDLPADPAPER
ncbi:dipeptidase [Pseudactinotalea sp. Z1732]|uniref:dipeptidase n=1 Tax=Pseudactinotalea sp. Z1732 TaxID=3413026 RepID=UPI003C7CCFD3